jgi:hypothetical protein
MVLDLGIKEGIGSWILKILEYFQIEAIEPTFFLIYDYFSKNLPMINQLVKGLWVFVGKIATELNHCG